MGFRSSIELQINKAFWIDACFKYYSLDFQNSSSLFLQKDNKTLIQPEINEFLIPLNAEEFYVQNGSALNSPNFQMSFPADSTEEEKLLKEKMEIIDSVPSSITDTSALVADSVIIIDSLALDSTNRLKYFKYDREDKPYVEIRPKKQSKFFVQPSPAYVKRSIEMDSTGKYVIIKEKIGTQETKIVQRVPIEDYIYLKLGLRERDSWETLGYSYKLKDEKMGLSQLITDITDFEIPLPSVGVLSIFGEPKISLKIGGAVQIHGAWRSETTEGVTASRLGNTRNEPDFKQQVQINVSGTIGDKLNIVADWNTERTFEYENQLKIKYTGYDDEIIQSIEAGNVSLQTSSLIGGAEALFGIKAQFKLGPFSLTGIASQKKGETKEVSVSGGSTSQDYTVRAYGYSDNHYFVDQSFANNDLFSAYYFNIPAQVNPDLQIYEIEVWKSINVISSDRSKERNANCYINLPPLPLGETTYDPSWKDPIPNPIPGEEETGRFLKLEESVDYILHPETGFISFKTSLNEQDIIAVAYIQGTGDITFGELIAANSDTASQLVLKLVKPKNLQPRFTTAWDLQLKNIYPTGARNVKKEGFEFKINYELVGQEPAEELPTETGSIKLLEAFGLDQLGSGGSSTPDNVFDWRPGFTIFPETGEIIFPNLEPFGQHLPSELDSNQYNYQKIYDTTKTAASYDKGADKWLLIGKSTGTSTAVYQLGFNVVENSVKVILNGRELAVNVDYVVDYNIGQLTIRNDAALVPGADLRITYEQNDLFQLASKTLLGARGLYEFSDKTQLGFTILNLNQQTLSDKVRIGEEPLSNTIYGTDFKTSAELPFVTNILDIFTSTREMSLFNFTGEYAYMLPDPNTKKSTISEDGGKSIAYIDDFEGAKRLIPVGIGYTGWKDLSVPEGLNVIGGLDRQERMYRKAKSFWFNITPSDVIVDSIFGGRRQVARADKQITVLDYVFLPDTPGTYNWQPDLQQRENNWGGVMRVLSSTANNLIEQNIEFFEFWMHISEAPPNATLTIDLGRISEDVIPDNTTNSEDLNFNDAIDEGEDTGLDGFLDPQERTEYQSTKGDPSGDNFRYVSGETNTIFDYFNINGSQGNAVLTDVGLLPDTEDLNRNGNVDLTNSYFRYQIPLDTTAQNPFREGGGFTSSGWYLFRVPLKDTAATFGNPSLSNVE
ncbi:MAG TPA: cell surface protein SprA, partial [Ignavibacteriaceae bacterium]|nr:cell surface protein SprA [Ignavibacteriaceae bacterium]